MFDKDVFDIDRIIAFWEKTITDALGRGRRLRPAERRGDLVADPDSEPGGHVAL